MKVFRPRSDDEEYAGMEVAHLLSSGSAASAGYELDDEEWAEFQREKRERLARKRPCGFTAWPEPEGEQIEKLDDGARVPGTPGKANTRKPRSRSRK